MERFELMQIWIFDPKLGQLADEQWDRMGAQFGTNSIPLHAVVSPEGKELSRLDYDPTLTEAQYLAFLRRGLNAMTR
jgi:hypothetical protein